MGSGFQTFFPSLLGLVLLWEIAGVAPATVQLRIGFWGRFFAKVINGPAFGAAVQTVDHLLRWPWRHWNSSRSKLACTQTCGKSLVLAAENQPRR